LTSQHPDCVINGPNEDFDRRAAAHVVRGILDLAGLKFDPEGRYVLLVQSSDQLLRQRLIAQFPGKYIYRHSICARLLHYADPPRHFIECMGHYALYCDGGSLRNADVVRAAIVLLLLLLAPSAAVAQAEKRIALLIGNEAYGSEIGRLANPHNDVGLLEQALKGLGFEVVTVGDAGLGALNRAVNAYARHLQAAGPGAIGFFYYSGHGASDGSTNTSFPLT
jgi:hypothetical protein